MSRSTEAEMAPLEGTAQQDDHGPIPKPSPADGFLVEAGPSSSRATRLPVRALCAAVLGAAVLVLVIIDSTGVGLAVSQAVRGFVGSEFLRRFLAGGVSGAIAKTCTAPIERVKLLIQTQDANPLVMSGEAVRYAGVIDCFQRVAREQGPRAFWRGNMANIYRYFPTMAFNFAFKDHIKDLFPEVDKGQNFWAFFAINLASGGMAGAGSLLVVYPLDYARTRLATDVGSAGPRFKGAWHCIAETYRSAGIRGLYNGIGVSVMGIIPYRGVYFGLFDTMSGFNPYHDAENHFWRALSKFLIAQASALAAAYASYPFDTVRRRLQLQSEVRDRDRRTYRGVLDCFRTIVREEGFVALFKGAGANAVRTVGAALVLVLYSEITALF